LVVAKNVWSFNNHTPFCYYLFAASHPPPQILDQPLFQYMVEESVTI